MHAGHLVLLGQGVGRGSGAVHDQTTRQQPGRHGDSSTSNCVQVACSL